LWIHPIGHFRLPIIPDYTPIEATARPRVDPPEATAIHNVVTSSRVPESGRVGMGCGLAALGRGCKACRAAALEALGACPGWGPDTGVPGGLRTWIRASPPPVHPLGVGHVGAGGAGPKTLAKPWGPGRVPRGPGSDPEPSRKFEIVDSETPRTSVTSLNA
jgi:hypothetical protein